MNAGTGLGTVPLASPTSARSVTREGGHNPDRGLIEDRHDRAYFVEGAQAGSLAGPSALQQFHLFQQRR